MTKGAASTSIAVGSALLAMAGLKGARRVISGGVTAAAYAGDGKADMRVMARPQRVHPTVTATGPLRMTLIDPRQTLTAVTELNSNL